MDWRYSIRFDTRSFANDGSDATAWNTGPQIGISSEASVEYLEEEAAIARGLEGGPLAPRDALDGGRDARELRIDVLAVLGHAEADVRAGREPRGHDQVGWPDG